MSGSFPEGDGAPKALPELSPPVGSSAPSEPADGASTRHQAMGLDLPAETSDAQNLLESFSASTFPTFDASFAEDSGEPSPKPLETEDDLVAAFAGAADAAAAKSGRAKKQKKKKSHKLKLQIAHQTVGRVRMKIASAKGDPELLKQVAGTFRAIPGITQITINPVTGSIILCYDEENQKAFNDRLSKSMMADRGAMMGSEFDELARKIQNEAEFLAERSEAARAVVEFFKQLDRDIKVASHNVVDLKIVLAVGVIGLTLFEMGAHAATPVWLTLSIFTFNHFLELRSPADEDARAPVMAPVFLKPVG